MTAIEATYAGIVAIMAAWALIITIFRSRLPGRDLGGAAPLAKPGTDSDWMASMFERLASDADKAKADFRSDLEGLSKFFEVTFSSQEKRNDMLVERLMAMVEQANSRCDAFATALATRQAERVVEPRAAPAPAVSAAEMSKAVADAEMLDALDPELRRVIESDLMLGNYNNGRGTME